MTVGYAVAGCRMAWSYRVRLWVKPAMTGWAGAAMTGLDSWVRAATQGRPYEPVYLAFGFWPLAYRGTVLSVPAARRGGRAPYISTRREQSPRPTVPVYLASSVTFKVTETKALVTA